MEWQKEDPMEDVRKSLLLIQNMKGNHSEDTIKYKEASRVDLKDSSIVDIYSETVISKKRYSQSLNSYDSNKLSIDSNSDNKMGNISPSVTKKEINQRTNEQTVNNGMKNMVTFGNGNEFKFNQRKSNPIDPLKEENYRGEQTPSSEDSNSINEEFISFGHSVKTHIVMNNINEIFTHNVEDVKNPILLNGLTILEDKDILATAGNSDKTLRLWTILKDQTIYSLKLEHEMKIFEHIPTNLKYLKERELLLAGDLKDLIFIQMKNFFKDKTNKPKTTTILKNYHSMRCLYHLKTDKMDYLVTAKGKRINYYDLKASQKVKISSKTRKFTQSIMAFEPINKKCMIVASGKLLSFWDLEKHEKIGKDYLNHEDKINVILYIKRRLSVLSGSNDGIIFLYKLDRKKISLELVQKISVAKPKMSSSIDSLFYFKEKSMLFCTNNSKEIVVYCFNSSNTLEEKSKIKDFNFQVNGLYFWKKQVSLIAYSYVKPKITILTFKGVNNVY